MATNIDWVDAAIGKYVTGKLRRFRARLEQEAEQSVGDLEVNAALLLSDLCRFLGLDEQQHDYVLGGAGVRYVQEVVDAHASVRVNPLPVGCKPVEGAAEAMAVSRPKGGSR